MAQDALLPSLRVLKRSGHLETAQTESSVAEPAPSAARLILHIGERPARPLPLDVSGRLVLGVATNDNALQPDVDLNRFEARRSGVQRRHAALIHDQNFVYIEDLNSEGGTRINGLRLMPGKRYRLRNHDELELGELRLTLRLLPR